MSERYTIHIRDAAFSCRPEQRVLEAMAGSLFPKAKPGLTVGCRRGGCGICRVRVLEGNYETSAMSASFVSEAEQQEGYALACCIYPRGDLSLVPARKEVNQINKANQREE